MQPQRLARLYLCPQIFYVGVQQFGDGLRRSWGGLWKFSGEFACHFFYDKVIFFHSARAPRNAAKLALTFREKKIPCSLRLVAAPMPPYCFPLGLWAT